MSTDVAASWCCILGGTDLSHFHPIHNTSRQQRWWTLPEDVVAVIAPDDGRKHLLKHVELIKVNKSK